MNDLPQADWVHGFDDFTRSSHRKETINDPYADPHDRVLFEKGWFDITMPDLNQSNPLLLTYLIQNTIWWVEYAGLKGLRVDTYTYNDKEAISHWTKAVRNEYPHLNIVGECWQNSTAEIAYWQNGSQNHDGYNSHLPSVMDFPLNQAMSKAFNEDDQEWDKGTIRLYNSLARDFHYPDPAHVLIFCDNHDITRFAGQVENDIDKYKLAFSFLLTTRGIPQIYYGSEIMMEGDKSLGDGDIRRDFPGGWIDDERSAFTAEGRTGRENEVFDLFRKLLNWRKNNAVIHQGELLHFVPENNVYVYFRKLGSSQVMVVLNNNPVNITLDTQRYLGKERNKTHWESVLTGERWTDPKTISVNAKSALILQTIENEK
jgi:glycosidase